MEIEGKIIRDLPLQEGVSRAGNPWKKKEWVLETFGQYPRQVCFHFFGDRVDSNPLRIGESYAISYDIESREYNGPPRLSEANRLPDTDSLHQE